VSRQISATATARDRRKFFIAQIMLFCHKKCKKSLKMKIIKKIFSFFSTVNQYFPHIPYMASKIDFSAIFKNRASPVFYDSEQSFIFRQNKTIMTA
jgi:hypothetical protein